VIDIHTHLSIRAKSVTVSASAKRWNFWQHRKSVLPVMDRKNIKIMVNLTGGSAKGLEEPSKISAAASGSFSYFYRTHGTIQSAGLRKFQADEIERAHKAGAPG